MVKESEVSGKVQQNDIHLFYGRLLLAYEPRQNAMKTSKEYVCARSTNAV
jgi:hypothetical protein